LRGRPAAGAEDAVGQRDEAHQELCGQQQSIPVGQLLRRLPGGHPYEVDPVRGEQLDRRDDQAGAGCEPDEGLGCLQCEFRRSDKDLDRVWYPDLEQLRDVRCSELADLELDVGKLSPQLMVAELGDEQISFPDRLVVHVLQLWHRGGGGDVLVDEAGELLLSAPMRLLRARTQADPAGHDHLNGGHGRTAERLEPGRRRRRGDAAADAVLDGLAGGGAVTRRQQLQPNWLVHDAQHICDTSRTQERPANLGMPEP
jgi:hypothetical protein